MDRTHPSTVITILVTMAVLRSSKRPSLNSVPDPLPSVLVVMVARADVIVDGLLGLRGVEEGYFPAFRGRLDAVPRGN